MRKGDLVVPHSPSVVHELKETTFFNRGRQRQWLPDQPAIIFAESIRNIRGHDILKFQILLSPLLAHHRELPGLMQLSSPRANVVAH